MKAMLEVWHDGQYKPVGKVFPHPKLEHHIFLHEESGSQGHHNTSSPGGIDTVVTPWLAEHGVTEIHHYNRSNREFKSIGLHAFLTNGVIKTMAGRKRIFTHERFWYSDIGLPYAPPWCSDIVRFGGKQDGFTQLGLFGEG